MPFEGNSIITAEKQTAWAFPFEAVAKPSRSPARCAPATRHNFALRRASCRRLGAIFLAIFAVGDTAWFLHISSHVRVPHFGRNLSESLSPQMAGNRCQVFTAYLAPAAPTEVSARLLPGAASSGERKERFGANIKSGLVKPKRLFDLGGLSLSIIFNHHLGSTHLVVIKISVVY